MIQDNELRRLGIQLLNQEDLTSDQASTREEKWAYYVDSFLMHADTEGVPSDMINTSWLRRTITFHDSYVEGGTFVHGLQVKVCFNTYKLFYMVDTEDTLVHSDKLRNVGGKRWKYNSQVRLHD